ncbi:SbtR family transcriptional regulator [Flindersiella endophytica]
MSEKPLRADARRNRARVLEAAEAVFDELGPSASTEEIARRAGVGIGTVFRHFPTKEDLLAAIMKASLQNVFVAAGRLADEGDPGTAFFEFFTHLVELAARRKTVVDLLVRSGADFQADKPIGRFKEAVGGLLERAQAAGAVRAEVQLPEVMALLTGTCQAALAAGWDQNLRERTLAIIFAGLRA